MVEVLIGLVIFMMVVVMLGISASFAGVDSRDGNDWFQNRRA